MVLDVFALAKIHIIAMCFTMLVAGVGAILDVWLVKKSRSDALHPKWVFNLIELVLIGMVLYVKFGAVLPWWHVGWLFVNIVPLWSILHDCWIGAGLVGDPWHLGQGPWDQKVSRIFNQFGTKHPGKIFFYYKLFWFGILTGGFFAL